MHDSTTERMPTELTLTDCAMAMDGGSLVLLAVDQAGAQVELFLDASIQRQREGTVQFHANGKLVPRGSTEEARWLELLRRAVIKPRDARSTPEGTAIADNAVVLADDAAAYFGAIKQGPASAIASLATRFMARISSPEYQEGRAPAVKPSPTNRVRALLREGKMQEAIEAFHEAYPQVGLTSARYAVQAMADELDEARRRGDPSDGSPGDESP